MLALGLFRCHVRGRTANLALFEVGNKPVIECQRKPLTRGIQYISSQPWNLVGPGVRATGMAASRILRLQVAVDDPKLVDEGHGTSQVLYHHGSRAGRLLLPGDSGCQCPSLNVCRHEVVLAIVFS